MSLPKTALINIKIPNPKNSRFKVMMMNVTVPEYEAVCKKLLGGFTKRDWAVMGIAKEDAIARVAVDPVIRKKYDDIITKLLKQKYSTEGEFNASPIAWELFDALPTKHWLHVALYG
jgi:hypothetical protein